METIKPIKSIYLLLDIKTKIPDTYKRFLYLRDCWGLPQDLIGYCEGIKQSKVSLTLKEARRIHGEIDVAELVSIQFDPLDIAQIQNLPREYLNDTQVIAFVNDVLKLQINHLFYQSFLSGKHMRMDALASLGVQQKYLAKLFRISPPAVSMSLKTTLGKSSLIERPTRYELEKELSIEPQRHNMHSNNGRFIIANQ